MEKEPAELTIYKEDLGTTIASYAHNTMLLDLNEILLEEEVLDAITNGDRFYIFNTMTNTRVIASVVPENPSTWHIVSLDGHIICDMVFLNKQALANRRDLFNQSKYWTPKVYAAQTSSQVDTMSKDIIEKLLETFGAAFTGSSYIKKS